MTITVEDQNDCIPYFDPMTIPFDVSEDVLKDTVVATIAGLDNDVSGKDDWMCIPLKVWRVIESIQVLFTWKKIKTFKPI